MLYCHDFSPIQQQDKWYLANKEQRLSLIVVKLNARIYSFAKITDVGNGNVLDNCDITFVQPRLCFPGCIFAWYLDIYGIKYVA